MAISQRNFLHIILLAGIGLNLVAWLELSAGGASSASVPGYSLRLWQTDDGLPGNTVTAIVQTRDGYLWLGGRNGLARFDGERFTLFDGSNTPELHSPHVTTLFEDPDGTLWIGHETGELTSLRAGKFYTVPVLVPWSGGKIHGIGADLAGDIWLLNEAAELKRVKDGLVIPAPARRPTRLLAMVSNPKGGLWIQRDNEVSVLEDGQLKPVPFGSDIYIQGIGASRDGGLWVMTQMRMQKWKDGMWAEDLGLAPWEWAAVYIVIETKDGRIVAATSDHGYFLVTPGKGVVHLDRASGFVDDWVTSLCEDREGNLWAGTGNGGLAMLRPANITTPSPPDQWQGRAVLSVTASADGGLWIGTEGAGVYRFENGSWTNFSASAGIGNPYIWSVALDPRDRAWAGTWGGGLLVQNQMRFERPPELSEFRVPTTALLPLRDGGLLVGTREGLLRYEPGKVNWLARKPELSFPDVRAVGEAPDGTVWFGMFGGGLGRYKEGVVRQFRRADGLSSDFVQCLHLAEDGTIWIGTFGGGINRFKDGRFTAITKGLPNTVICDIQDDGLGYFWISSHGGIMRINKSELNRAADGHSGDLPWLTYSLSDGMPTLQCSGGFQPASCKTPDGRLWFPTSKGLVAVNPGNVTTNEFVPPVIIEKLIVDDQLLSESGSSRVALEIPPGRHRFEFQFTGLSFTAPEKVRFKYRLEGLEQEWVNVQSPRRAYYSYIPPGHYQFQVRACNNDGVWNEAAATLAFTVLPWFWQTWWFRTFGGVLMAVASGGVVWFDGRRRMRRKLELIEQQQAIERERARIAKDIHDDLGAGLTRISLLSESLPTDGNPVQAAEVLNYIFITTREMTQTMDEIVWAVNPQHDTLDSLASYLGNFTQDFLASTGVRCRLDVPLQLPNWRLDAEVRHNLFLAVKESLSNALRHAQATEIRVSLSAGDAAFVIVVEDNGRGIPAARADDRAGRVVNRNGLANMRQRLAQIGGRCEINTGEGTRVEFHVVLKPPLK